MTIIDESPTSKDVKKLKDERGSMFAVGERIFGNFKDDDVVSLAWDYEPLDLAKMLAADGNARKIERVLTLPIRGATWDVIGEGPGAELVLENLGPMLSRIIEQCTGAITYRRSFFEKVWGTDDQGRFVYEKIAWRPPSSCTARFDRKTGTELGFYQRVTDAYWMQAAKHNPGEEVLGQITIDRHKAFVYTHGRHREPVKGVSDLEVALNAYTKKQKIKFLWAQYLENQSLPKTTVYGTDISQAQDNADSLASARASAVVPMLRPVEGERPWDILESSGKGADQFVEALRYFDWEQTNSVLAGFTELANSSTGAGSYALSADQSEFFLASEQAEADEIAEQIVEGLFTPLVELNFGLDVEIPKLKIGPIGRQQTDRALELLTEIVSSTRPMVPLQFISMLLIQVAEQVGLDPSEVEDAVELWGDDMQAQLQSAYAAQIAAAQQPTAFGPGDARSTKNERAAGYAAAEQESVNRGKGRPDPVATAVAGETTGDDVRRAAKDNALRGKKVPGKRVPRRRAGRSVA